MFIKSLVGLLASVALVNALEGANCDTLNATTITQVQITDGNNFCTMMTGYGVTPVAQNEGCASVYCYGAPQTALTTPPPADGVAIPIPMMPAGFILSSHFAQNTTYVQVTGCMDGSKWGLNPTDEGGQMDSHGWATYSCKGKSKFVSLLEPATNTYCLRCCDDSSNEDCNTSISTKGCWNVVPGDYSMPDGSACPLPAGAPPANSSATASMSAPATSLLPSATTAAGASGSNAGSNPSGTAAVSSLPTAKSGAADMLQTGSAIAAALVMAVAVAAF